MKQEKNNVSVKWAMVTLGVVILVIGGSIAALSLRPEAKVTDFESCKAAGNPIMESYPEQCMSGGVSYTNESQSHPEYPPEERPPKNYWYIGLPESDALARAEKENISARVVERDGESLPTTMDFVYGRHNLYIKDGTVYKVEIEGQTTDTN